MLDKKNIEALRSVIKPYGYLDYRDYLQAIYRYLKNSLGKYSYLAFAEDFGFSKTNVMHLIIRGKRPLSNKAALKIIEALSLTSVDRTYFETLVAYQNSRNSAEREQLMRKILTMKRKTLSSEDACIQLEFFSEWYHPAIYEMTHLEGFCSDPKWIADQLQPKIRPEQARKSLHLLESLNLIVFDQESQRYRAKEFQVSTGDEIASVAVIRYHQRLIELGRESITQVNEDERDISGITVCLSKEQAAKIKDEIQVFRKKMMAIADESTGADVVYQMNVQLFPLTKGHPS